MHGDANLGTSGVSCVRLRRRSITGPKKRRNDVLYLVLSLLLHEIFIIWVILFKDLVHSGLLV